MATVIDSTSVTTTDATASDQVIGDKGQFNTITNAAGTGAPELSEGATIPATKSLDSDLIKDASGVYTMLDYNGGAPISKVDKLQADTITNEAGTGAPSATYGISFPAGQGIDFSASAGGGATSSIFDDYEEGGFSPSYNTSVGDQGTVTYGTRQGLYTKKGNEYTFTLDLEVTATTGGTGSMRIGGLPYTPNSSYATTVSITCQSGLTYTGTLKAKVLVGGTFIYLVVENGGAYTTVPHDATFRVNVSGSIII